MTTTGPLRGASTSAAAAAPPALWYPAGRPPAFTPAEILAVAARIREPVHIVAAPSGSDTAAGAGAGAVAGLGIAVGGSTSPAGTGQSGLPLLGTLPPLCPEWLGDRSFAETHGVRFPYAAGEMAGGIATVAMVSAMARAGMLGFFGAAGLDPDRVERSVAELSATLTGKPNWGVNLIHSPGAPALEERIADIALRHRVPAVSASAFMALTPAVVHIAARGLHRGTHGRIQRRTRLFAKVSRPEVAGPFMSPAPPALLRALVERGRLTAAEAELASRVPVAEDVTVEADSGGHTDNRPLAVLLPVMLALRDELTAAHGYDRVIRVGAAGGLGTPAAVAAAFALGAAYVVTGSVNQATREAGLSGDAKRMLAQADIADVTMAPAADMFELGVKVQVLRRGTFFAPRSARLYQLYRDHARWEDIPPEQRAKVEKDVLQAPFDTVWAETRRFWEQRDPAQAARAEHDARHRMALVFRWYLGMSSRWAVSGRSARRADYQIWCGPAMGAFNRWAAHSFLADPDRRDVAQIALNFLEGAALITRAHQLRSHGVPVPAAAFAPRPRRLA
ncbi:2-nitropropane dioxygenase [Streptosporangium nondiastaticum]|uniref:2-nitropropane dioxygenase n=1 Tax=Streptosporangium nondiastaticum TaxID=35764 RepID=A0A9X7PJ36_9ACTN|nr:PfaD family polyunsaturated fatty acid/polyketide biosynthesis protein [Streptosporangium nondiastaticum]PSJ29696.1 2-nitropropane dioxygenase [Streptosporangium nondiastaticum]